MNDTIEALVGKIQGGAREDMDRLWDTLHSTVWKQAHCWAAAFREHRPDITAEDLYQCGYLALDRAVQKYTPDCGAPFLTWFLINLRLEFAQTAGHRSAQVLGALEAAKAPRPWSVLMERALRSLPDAMFEVLYLRYGLGLSPKEAGLLLEMRTAKIKVLEQRGLLLLREGTQGAQLQRRYRELLDAGHRKYRIHT